MRIKLITLKDKTRKYQIIFKSVLIDISIIKKQKYKKKELLDWRLRRQKNNQI